MKQSIIDIKWSPDKDIKIPMYIQIAEYIRNNIMNGNWPSGAKLPSQRKLAELFNVNRSTIVMAMDELRSYGFIEGCAGRGTIICNNTWSLLAYNNTPDWGTYIKEGQFKENIPVIQAINKYEYTGDFIRLGTGELSPGLYPHEMMSHVFKRLSERITSMNYLEPLGLYELRKVIAQRLRKKGIEVEPSCILITSGSLQAMHLLSVCILKKGSVVYTEDISYLQSLKVFQSAGMELKKISMDKEGIEYYKIPSNNDKENSSLIYTIPTFQNPSGIVMSEKRRKDIYSFAMKNRIPILEDDAYGELYFDNIPPNPIKAIDNSGTVIYLGSISKTLAPGLRIGWLIGPKSIVERLGDAKMQMDYGASSISQFMLMEFLKSGLYDEYLENIRKELKLRRDIMIKVLDENFKDIAEWNVPSGGFYIWLTFKEKINTEKLFYEAVKNKILINPGSVYGDIKNNNSIRLSYAFEDKVKMRNGIKKLRDLINRGYR